MTDKPRKDGRINVRIPQDLKAKANDKSHRTGISLTHVITQAIKAWVDRPDPA